MISKHTQITTAICFSLGLATLPLTALAQDTHQADREHRATTQQAEHRLPNDFAEMQAITADALRDLELGELASASNKIMQVTQILKLREWDSADTANIHIAQALIVYNRFHYLDPDLARETALESFRKAIQLDPNIKIPSKYRSDEIKQLFKIAHQPIEAPPDEDIPDYDSIFGPQATPAPQIACEPAAIPTETTLPPENTIQPITTEFAPGIDFSTDTPSLIHTPPNYCNICSPCNIAATISPNKNTSRVIVYYTKDPTIAVSGLEMTPSYTNKNIMSVSLPISDFDSSHVFYYINILDHTGKVVARFPKNKKYMDLNLVNTCKDAVSSSNPSNIESNTPPQDAAQLTTINPQEDKQFDNPLMQFSVMIGTAFGVVNDKTENCAHATNCTKNPRSEFAIETGFASLPLHLRANLMFNLPYHLQLGAYLRGQLINIVKNNIFPSNDINPAQYNIMVGLAIRYLALWDQPYRLYIGLGFGWGGANATVNLGPNFNNFKDIYLFKGPLHLAPEIGFLWSFHKNVGLAVEFAMPIVFPERPSVFFDLSVGPYIQF